MYIYIYHTYRCIYINSIYICIYLYMTYIDAYMNACSLWSIEQSRSGLFTVNNLQKHN